MKIDSEKLREFLVDAGMITLAGFKQLQKEVGENQERLEALLIEKHIVAPATLLQIKAHLLGIPFIDLEKTIIDPEVLRLIPEETAKSLNIVAYRKEGDTLAVAMLDPDNLQTIDFIKKRTSLEIIPRLTNGVSLQSVLKQYRETLQEEFGQLISQASKEAKISSFRVIREGKELGEKELSTKALQEVAEKLPIIQVVESLLRHAVVQNASDIHIEPSEQAVVVRYRIDGILHDVMTLPRQVYPAMLARIKVLSNLKLDEHRLPQDGRFKIEGEGEKVSIRVSVIPVLDGEKIVMRLLQEGVVGLTLESLGLAGQALEILHANIRKPNGMILVSGPTGSGKTTTLYAILDILNTSQVNIATIEDPIEYRMPRINQTQVKPEIGLTFASGLRSLVRQDPDIIMVGEIRDNETASLAINAALTGHLVLSTLHTNSAAGALPRLLDMKVEPFLIASTVNVIIGQRLVRKLCQDIKKSYTLNTDQIKMFEKQYGMKRVLEILREKGAVKKEAGWEEIPFYEPGVSKNCTEGYKGRIGIFEVLSLNQPIKKLIISQATSDDIQAQAIKEGMLRMFEDGFVKAAKGLTSIEEIVRVTKE